VTLKGQGHNPNIFTALLIRKWLKTDSVTTGHL